MFFCLLGLENTRPLGGDSAPFNLMARSSGHGYDLGLDGIKKLFHPGVESILFRLGDNPVVRRVPTGEAVRFGRISFSNLAAIPLRTFFFSSAGVPGCLDSSMFTTAMDFSVECVVALLRRVLEAHRRHVMDLDGQRGDLLGGGRGEFPGPDVGSGSLVGQVPDVNPRVDEGRSGP